MKDYCLPVAGGHMISIGRRRTSTSLGLQHLFIPRVESLFRRVMFRRGMQPSMQRGGSVSTVLSVLAILVAVGALFLAYTRPGPDGAVGPTGTQGPKGDAGATGATGPAGTARAYARVNPFAVGGPAFVAGATRNFTGLTRPTTGVYCLTPAAGIDPARTSPVVSPERSALPVGGGLLAYVSAARTGCPATAFQVETFDWVAGGDPAHSDQVAFTIIIP